MGQRIVVTLLFWLSVGSQLLAQETPSVTIEYIAHASFRITAPTGERVLIDPYGSRIWIGYDFPAGVDADAVLITHPHYDHDGGTSRDLPPPWPKTVTVLREPGVHDIDGFGVIGVAGKHADPYGQEFGQTNTIWVLEVAGVRIAHIGDNGPLSRQAAAAIGDIDILMIPIDSQYHILKEREIRAILQLLAPGVVIPMHFRLDDLEPDKNKPSDLGDIDGWLGNRSDVRRLNSHRTSISAQDIPDPMQILVFDHWPTLEQP